VAVTGTASEVLRRLIKRLTPAGLRGWPPEGVELVALDVETTGLDPGTAELLSIGAVPIRGRRVVLSDRFEAMLRRDGPTHAGSVRVHRLRAMDLTRGLPPAEALAQFCQWLGDRPVLGYCIDFDRAVLDRALRAGGLQPLDVVAYELRTLHLLATRGPDSHDGVLPDLDMILRDAGIPPLARHTAIGDAVATALAYLALRQRSRGAKISR
jgi:DNA polymerase III subunit epsilon